MRKLMFKQGHKKDMFFSIVNLSDREHIITHVFYNRDKCLNYIHEQNRRRENEAQDAE